MSTPADRLGVALAPRTPEVEALVARRIAEFAADLGDADLVDAVAADVEEGTSITLADLADRAGVTRRQLTYWTQHGYLSPVPRPPGSGSGYPIAYPTEAILKARLMGSLVSLLRMAPETASSTAEEILATGRAQVGPYVVTRRSLS